MTLLANSSTVGEHTLRLRGANCGAVGVMIFDSENSGSGSVLGFRPTAAATGMDLINCLVANVDDDSFQNTSSSTRTYNCTSIGAGQDGFDNNTSVWNLKNCLSDGSAGDDFAGGGRVMTNCASSDASADGTAARPSQTFTYVNAGAGNYHLAPSDTGARGFGADLSGDSDYPFDDDIDRETITAWSIGFDSLVAVAVKVIRTLTTLGVGL